MGKSGRTQGNDQWPKVVRFEDAVVKVFRRANGNFEVAWREAGRRRTTSKVKFEKAMEWAGEKARNIAQATGQRWVTPAMADAIAALRRIAGSETGAVGKLIAEVEAARGILAGRSDLVTACKWFAEQGPIDVEEKTVAEAVERFLAEYESAPLATQRTFKTELKAFSEKHGAASLLSVKELTLRQWVDRKTDGNAAAPRTVKNRITTLVTFMNRAKSWGWLPDAGKTAAEKLRRPRLPSAGREILTVEEGKALLNMVGEARPELEVFVVIAGWLGLRPSEIQRLQWSAFDFKKGYLHLCPKVAAKVQQERFVPMDARVCDRLQELRQRIKEAGGRWKAGDVVTLFRAREFVSVMARENGVLKRWPSDVLRHSYCSYRLAVLGDVARVAEEAGNSAAVIRSNYRRPVTPEEGAAWWALLDPRSDSPSDKSTPTPNQK